MEKIHLCHVQVTKLCTDAGRPYATVSWNGESASDNVAVTSFTSDIAKNEVNSMLEVQ